MSLRARVCSGAKQRVLALAPSGKADNESAITSATTIVFTIAPPSTVTE